VTEPDVALTDYGLALECAVFAFILLRTDEHPTRLRRWMMIFFISAGVAPLAGGTVHGLFLDEASTGNLVLWPTSLIAIGVSVLSCWLIGAILILEETWVRRILIAAALQFIVYTAIVLFWNDSFWIAAVGYLPAGVFLMVAFVVFARRQRSRKAFLGAWGVVVSTLATVLQQLHVTIHPEHFNHNALYHLIMAAGLALLFLGTRSVLRQSGGMGADST
jgi:Family of unknown function (DUF6962)